MTGMKITFERAHIGMKQHDMVDEKEALTSLLVRLKVG